MIIIGVGYFLTNSPNTQSLSSAVNTNENAEVVTTKTATENEEVTPSLNSTSQATTEADARPLAVGTYTTYDENAVSLSAADTNILFFHATWCPTCRGLDSDISSNMANIPDGVAIYKVDYDTAVALRQKYGVTTQHTLVEIDDKGNLLQKWNLSRTLNDVVTKI